MSELCKRIWHVVPLVTVCNGAGKLRQLSWSSNSELLAVVLTDTTPDDKTGSKDVVQLWHRSNWHWYLKQEQVYPDAGGVRVCWDEVAPWRLHICSGAAWYRQVGCLSPFHLFQDLHLSTSSLFEQHLDGLGWRW